MLNPFGLYLLAKPRLSSTVFWFLRDPVKVPELPQLPPISLTSCRIGHESLGLSCSPTGPDLFLFSHLECTPDTLPSTHCHVAHHSRIPHPPSAAFPTYHGRCLSSFRRTRLLLRRPRRHPRLLLHRPRLPLSPSRLPRSVLLLLRWPFIFLCRLFFVGIIIN